MVRSKRLQRDYIEASRIVRTHIYACKICKKAADTSKLCKKGKVLESKAVETQKRYYEVNSNFYETIKISYL